MQHLYLLPTGESMNPTSPEHHFCYDDNSSAVILRTPKGRLIVATTYGNAIEDTNIGERVAVTSDQSRRDLGVHTVIGIRDFASGAVKGEVPNRKMTHKVYK